MSTQPACYLWCKGLCAKRRHAPLAVDSHIKIKAAMVPCGTVMNHEPSRAAAFVSLLACTLLVPVVAFASPDGPGQRAGEISRLIPAVKIMRGADFVSASEKTPIYWQDLVNTLAGGRARMSLDDGSVLNVGSDSNLRVLKHDAGAQQTELALGVGKMRTQAQKIAHAGGKFEVRTPVGVAGVVGTDFFVSFQKKAMSVIVFEGSVKLCNLAGKCVIIPAGKMSTVCAIAFRKARRSQRRRRRRRSRKRSAPRAWNRFLRQKK